MMRWMCFGTVAAHRGRNMWQSKTAHPMAKMRKRERGSNPNPQCPSRVHPWQPKIPPLAPPLRVATTSQKC